MGQIVKLNKSINIFQEFLNIIKHRNTRKPLNEEDIIDLDLNSENSEKPDLSQEESQSNEEEEEKLTDESHSEKVDL